MTSALAGRPVRDLSAQERQKGDTAMDSAEAPHPVKTGTAGVRPIQGTTLPRGAEAAFTMGSADDETHLPELFCWDQAEMQSSI